MYCGKCGSHVKEGEGYCPQCGAPIVKTGASEAPAREGAPAAVAGNPPASLPAEGQLTEQLAGGNEGAAEPQPKKKNAKIAIIAVAVVAVIVVAAGIGVWWKSDQDAKAAAQALWEQAHTAHVTQVAVEAPGFDEAATAIPVQVSGTDLDGNHVSEVQYLRPDAMHVSTLAGSYDLMFPGGYFTGTGKVVKAPEATQHIEIAADDGAQEAGEGSGESASPTLEPLVYVEVPDLEVTDDLIAVISGFASQDPEDGGKSEALGNAATEHRDAALAEEERRKAEEEARLEAEKAAREAIPAGSYSYAAATGGYRGFITINADGSMSLMEAMAMRPDRSEYLFTLERTGSTAPNGAVMYRAVPVSGNPYANDTSIYYDQAQGGVVFGGIVYLGPQ